jgi:hypothetical protein
MLRILLKQFAVIGVLKIAYIGHWMLLFRSDKSRIRKDHSPENFALLRRLAINLLKQEKEFKGSLKMKRYLAGMDNNYLVQILDSAS